MSLQDWNDAIQNSCTSFNARLRAIASSISGTLGITIQFYPHGQRPGVPAYPYLSAWFLNTGDWDSARRKLLTRIQLDVFTTGSQLGQAQRIAGLVFKNFGFDPVLSVMGCTVTQTDYEAAKALPPRQALPLHDMQLEIQNGWESQPDEDPAVSHLFTNLNLYFE